MTSSEAFQGNMGWSVSVGFSQAVRSGGFVFVSGQPGVDVSGRIAGDGGIEAQVRQAFANIDAILQEAGSRLSNVVRFTTILRNIEDMETVVRVRRELLTPPYPADTIFQVANLARPQFLVEIDAIATYKGDS